MDKGIGIHVGLENSGLARYLRDKTQQQGHNGPDYCRQSEIHNYRRCGAPEPGTEIKARAGKKYHNPG
ncbi:unnamed protein product, partial [marine sediment metagenome]